jgi:hypothetical protein
MARKRAQSLYRWPRPTKRYRWVSGSRAFLQPHTMPLQDARPWTDREAADPDQYIQQLGHCWWWDACEPIEIETALEEVQDTLERFRRK